VYVIALATELGSAADSQAQTARHNISKRAGQSFSFAERYGDILINLPFYEQPTREQSALAL